MAIRGNLAEAALADVVQLLALGRRTGRLSVARDGELGTMYFVDGAVAHATLAHRRDPLGAALVRAGLLDDADLRAALVEQAAEPDVPLGAILVRRGCVPHDGLRAELAAQTAEAGYELLGWARGTFSFDADVAPLAIELTPRLDVGSLLLESARRTDDGVLIASEVPGPSSTFAAVPIDPCAVLGSDVVLDAESTRVLAALDGRRDVQGVAEASGFSVYRVSRAIYALVRAGRVRRVASAPPTTAAGRTASARADEHLNLGIAFARANMLDEALRELRRALELRADDVGARAHLGAVALRAGRLDEAAAVLGEAATLPGVTGAALHALGVVRHRLGQLALADEAFVRASARGLANDPRHLTARAALALDLRSWSDARALLDRARAVWPEPPAVWFHYAVLAALATLDFTEADDLTRAAVAAHPRAAALLANAAARHVDAGRPPSEALALVRAALAERPDLAPALRLHGDLEYRAGHLDRARDAYAAATRLAPESSAGAWARLGSLALRGGDALAAQHAWERACSLQPDHPTARANLEALQRAGVIAPVSPSA